MVKSKHLTVRPDGKIDTDDPTNRNYLRKRQDEIDGDNREARVQAVKADTGRVVGAKKAPVKTMPQVVEPVEEYEDGLPSKHDLERHKLSVQIEKEKVVTWERRKELIPRELVQRFFDRLFAIDTTEYLTIPARIAPELAATFGVDDPAAQIKAEEIIQRELYEILQRSKDAVKKAMAKADAEAVEDASSA